MTYCSKEATFNNIFPKKEGGLKVRINAEEFAVQKSDKGFIVFFYAKACDVYGIENKEKQKPEWPNIGRVEIRDDEKFAGEKVLCMLLSKLEEKKVYRGFLEVNADLTGASKIISNPEKLEFFADDLLRADDLPGEPEFITDVVFGLKPSAGGAKQSFSKLDTAKQRLEAINYLCSNADAMKAIDELLLLTHEGKAVPNDKMDVILALIA